MAEKLREAAARGDVARVARLLDEDIKPLPDEVSLSTSSFLKLFRPLPSTRSYRGYSHSLLHYRE